jgi:hypothetical protein
MRLSRNGKPYLHVDPGPHRPAAEAAPESRKTARLARYFGNRPDGEPGGGSPSGNTRSSRGNDGSG